MSASLDTLLPVVAGCAPCSTSRHEAVLPCLLPQVAEAAFDLLFAFDEVISLGYKDNVTVAQVRSAGRRWVKMSRELSAAGYEVRYLACHQRRTRVAARRRPSPPPLQVRQNTEMESHEEKLHKMIIQSKIAETKASRARCGGLAVAACNGEHAASSNVQLLLAPARLTPSLMPPLI